MVISDGTGTTVIAHNQKEPGQTSLPWRTGGCSEPGCHKAEFSYVPEMVQIEALIEISTQCQQAITHNCTNNPLSRYSWWTDRNGESREYWHGDFSGGQNGCQCSFTESGCTPNALGDKV